MDCQFTILNLMDNPVIIVLYRRDWEPDEPYDMQQA